jgi:hypothetical protein
MNLFNTVLENSQLSFTGRLNVLSQDNHQFLGLILFQNGKLIDCQYSGLKGSKALASLVVDADIGPKGISLVSEPEVIDLEHKTLSLDEASFQTWYKKFYNSYKAAVKFKPPEGIKLLIDPDFVGRGEDISGQEFEVLSLIADNSRVEDIYKNSPFFEYETTNFLINLRKKRAIKVFGKQGSGNENTRA